MSHYTEFLAPEELAAVKDFIVSHWEETVRVSPQDDGTLVGLPHPYTIPSRKGAFQEIYYWDTYFTSLGLIESGRTDLAVFNAKNLLSMLDRFGFVPNGNRTFYLTRSQPPYLASLVMEVAKTPGNAGLLAEALPSLLREYEFWTTQRNSPTGLSHYGQHGTREQLIDFHTEIAPRTGLGSDPESVVDQLSHIMAECESGWDFNPRFGKRCDEYCAVELNCLLYTYERLFAEHPEATGGKDWQGLAMQRIAKLNEFCWDEEQGGFFDYDFVNGRRNTVASCATFQPLWAGTASEQQAALIVEKMMPRLEFAFGLAACDVREDNFRWQWDYPNGWPCMQHMVAFALERYRYKEDARRIAQKYLATVCQSFRETGDLWEKYNVNDGTQRTLSEIGYPNSRMYGETEAGVTEKAFEEPPAMMGWTAGAFMTLLRLAGTAQ